MSNPNIIDDINERVKLTDLVNLIYPVGSIYMSTNNVSPATFLGGSWEQIQDKFLLCSGATYSAGSTGGSSTVKANVSVNNHTLTINQIPSHTHNVLCGYGDITGVGPDAFRYQYWGNSNRGWHNFLVQATGGSQGHNHGVTITAHNNMPPYLAVYVWKRTA